MQMDNKFFNDNDLAELYHKLSFTQYSIFYIRDLKVMANFLKITLLPLPLSENFRILVFRNPLLYLM